MLTIGRWTTEQLVGRYREATCACGTKKKVCWASVKRGESRSCGCYNREVHRKRQYKHGMKGTPTYMIWGGMINRCKNPSQNQYKYYGGRGITVCDRWKSFENFLSDMGEKPQDMSLDRIDNDKGYSPENCRWATRSEQLSNTSRNVKFMYDGALRTIVEISKKSGIGYGALRYRLLKLKLPLEKALVPGRACRYVMNCK